MSTWKKQPGGHSFEAPATNDTSPTAGASAAQRELQRSADAESDAAFVERIGPNLFGIDNDEDYERCVNLMRRAVAPPSVEFCAEIVDMVWSGLGWEHPLSEDEIVARVRAKLTAYQEGEHSTPQLEPGCCSAIKPCSHQRNDPFSLCENCKQAKGPSPAAERPNLGGPARLSDAELDAIEARCDREPLGPWLSKATTRTLVVMARGPAAIADAELDELDVLADAANDTSSWVYDEELGQDGGIVTNRHGVVAEIALCDESITRGAYIARIDPPTLKGLIARLRAAEAALRARGPASEDDVERVAEALREEMCDECWTFGRLARAAIAAIPDRYAQGRADEREADEWQPIDTAPKDGTRVLVKGPSGYIAPNDVHIETARTDLQYRGDAWLNDAGDRLSESWPAPTHWKHLAAIRAQPAVETAKQSNPFPRVECAGLRGAVEEGRKQLAHAAPRPASEDLDRVAPGPYDALIEERGTLLASVLEHAKTDLITAQIDWNRIVEIDAELSKVWPMPTHYMGPSSADIDEIVAARAALASWPADGWEPIETAPANVRIQVRHPASKGGEWIGTMRKTEFEDEGRGTEDWTILHYNGDSLVNHFHPSTKAQWRHLPPSNEGDGR